MADLGAARLSFLKLALLRASGYVSVARKSSPTKAGVEPGFRFGDATGTIGVRLL